MICAINPGKQVWSGDSGGPLTLTEKGKHFLVGVTSFSAGICDPSIPQGFGRYTSVAGWIKERMRGITCDF